MSVYEIVYGIDLLDDLHNYFPALLYSNNRFTTLTQVFHYIRHQMNRHFPGHGAGHGFQVTAARDASLILSLLSRVVDNRGAAAAAAALTPVIVAPTTEQLNEGSEIVTDLSGVCAVCQDVIASSDLCRRLRACGHVYHKSCIDQWYLRSVRCPTCRHDVREAVTAPVPVVAEPAEPAEPAAQTNDTVSESGESI